MRALAWFLALIAVALAAMAVLTYPVWMLLHPYFGFPFHRVADRIGMLALLAGFVPVARRLKLADRASLGYGLPARELMPEMGIGLALGVATLAPAVALMTALGLLHWPAADGLPRSAWLALVTKPLFSGIAVAFIEETFLRGAMLSAIRREAGARVAVLLTAALYSASHFVASVHIAPEQVTPASGVAMLAGALRAFAHPQTIADAFLCLMAVGALLGMIRVLTGNIAACVGLHAGWVWVMLVTHELARPGPGASLGFLVSRFDGFVGWLLLAWTVLLAVPLWRLYAARGIRGRA